MSEDNGDVDSQTVLKAVANEHNQAILSLLAVEPTYPRRIAELLTMDETGVARRLKRMSAAGLVEAEWEHVGKNVKIYRLIPEALQVAFAADGLRVEMLEPGGQRTSTSVVDRVPRRLPSVDGFVGREAELAVLEGPSPVVVVDGMPGVGKSSLVAAFVHQVKDEATVFFHRCRGTESIRWLASRLGVELADQGDRRLLDAVEAGAEVPDLTDLLLDAIDTPGRVVVLDDVHTIEDDPVERLLSEAIERTREGKLILSGRQRVAYNPALDHVERLHLTGLDDQAIDAFLEAEGIELPGDLKPQLRAEVGGHPLALALFLEASRAPDVEIEDLLDRIPEEDLERWLLREVDDNLGDRDRAVLAHAGLFRDTFTERDLRAVYDKDPTGALLRLRRRHLIEHLGDAYAIHEVLANHFRRSLDDQRALHDRLARHYLSKGTVEARLEAMHHYLAAGKRTRVLGLLEEDLDLAELDVIDQGYHNLYLRVLDRFDEADIRDPRQRALLHDEKGDIRFHRGEHETALGHHEQAAQLFDKLDEPPRLADLAWKRALSLEALGRRDDARQAAQEGLDHTSPGDREHDRLTRFLGEDS